jgi:hypothetical protein
LKNPGLEPPPPRSHTGKDFLPANGVARITQVTLSSSAWTALPTTALTYRKSLAIQNNSGITVYLGYDPDEAGTVGITLADGSERQYDYGPEVVVYAKAASGTPNVIVEEVS